MKQLFLFLFETSNGFDSRIVDAVREDAKRRKNAYSLQIIHIQSGDKYKAPQNSEEPLWVIPVDEMDNPKSEDALKKDCEALSIMLNPGDFEAIVLADATTDIAASSMIVGGKLIKCLHKYGVGNMDAILLINPVCKDIPHVRYALEAMSKTEEIDNVLSVPWRQGEETSRETVLMLISTLTLEHDTLTAYIGKLEKHRFSAVSMVHLDAPQEHVRSFVLRSALQTLLQQTIRPAADSRMETQTVSRMDIEPIKAAVIKVLGEAEEQCTGGFPEIDELYALMPLKEAKLPSLKEEFSDSRAWRMIANWYGQERADELSRRFLPNLENLRDSYQDVKTKLCDIVLRGTAEIAKRYRRPITDLQGMLENVLAQINSQLDEKKPLPDVQHYKRILTLDRNRRSITESTRATHVVFDTVYQDAVKKYATVTHELRISFWEQVGQTTRTFYRDCMMILADKLTATYNKLDVGTADFNEGFEDAYGYWFRRNCNDFTDEGDQLFLRHIGDESTASVPESSAESLHNELLMELEDYRNRKIEPIKLKIEKFFPELMLRQELLHESGDFSKDLNERLLSNFLNQKVSPPFVAEVGSNFNPVKYVFVFGKGPESEDFAKKIKGNKDGKADLWHDAFENSVEMLVRFEMNDYSKLGVYRLNK